MSVQERSWMTSARKTRTHAERPLVVYWLIALNAAIFAIGFVSESAEWESLIEKFGFFSVETAVTHHQVWRFVTYQFLHANLGHIALNMMGLWVFGQIVESKLGHKKFLTYYLVCGIVAALFYTLLGHIGIIRSAIHFPGYDWTNTPLIGASGSIYGVIAACAMLHPHGRIQLILPPINMSVRNFAIGILCVAAFVIIFNWNNAGGEAGHMGGMLAGFAIMFVGMMISRIRRHIHEERRLEKMTQVSAILHKSILNGKDSLTEEERKILKDSTHR